MKRPRWAAVFRIMQKTQKCILGIPKGWEGGECGDNWRIDLHNNNMDRRPERGQRGAGQVKKARRQKCGGNWRKLTEIVNERRINGRK